MNKVIYIEKRDEYKYPEGNDLYHPSILYPEYPFKKEHISSVSNPIYDMVRDSLYGLGLDSIHYGKESWNPLGEIINPGDVVVIKPNLVKHYDIKEQYNAALTHPSVVRAAIDFCIIAKAGKIILGDSPIQGADIDKIYQDCHYEEILGFYHSQGVKIEFIDFRSLIVKIDHMGIITPLKADDSQSNEHVTINLGKDSMHFSEGETCKYGICGCVEKKINEYHHGQEHNYVISKYILDADVIINLPKPKTHRFAGITGAQKNFVGVCSDKESLPHFKEGSKSVGGDETNRDSLISKAIAYVYRKYLWSCKRKENKYARFWSILYTIGCKLKGPQIFIHGMWYGNDTIWRTIIDLNMIILYADKNGKLDFTKEQRKIMTIGDMIISGEKEGPMNPTPKPLGIILASRNCAFFDFVFCKIAGFDSALIPTVYHSMKNEKLCVNAQEVINIFSNIEEWNEVPLLEFVSPQQVHFEPHPFWRDIL